MNIPELKREQLKLAGKIELRDTTHKIRTLGGIACRPVQDKLLASLVVCEFPSMKVLKTATYLLENPLPYHPGFLAYREMPAMLEALNALEEDPDILLVNGPGINHPLRIGLASHLGLVTNIPTIGVTARLQDGVVKQGKIIFENEIVGFEIRTKEHANPVYCSPGHLVSLGTVLNLVPQAIRYPHKLPEPLHLAHKLAKKTAKTHAP